jgi:50S ribosomal protein L16 3-hydroxylase
MIADQFPLPPASDQPLAMLGGLTPAQFMRRHWQKKPLLVKGAFPGFQALLSRPELFALSAQEEVESRLIVQKPGVGWTLKHGPFGKSAFPAFKQPNWTLLVQGVDLHHDGAHALMQQFRFLPDARLDDLMISWASEGGGVGPHFDSYDVFLIQAQGKRRWRIGRQKDLSLEEGVPLKILTRFEAEEEYVCEPGDMLYLPPKWAHDGVAVEGECMTYSVGFRVPQRGGLAGEIAQRLADDHEDETLYRDPSQAATQQPGRIPALLQEFTADALRRLLEQPEDMARALGEVMTEPKPKVWFEEPEGEWEPAAVRLDRRSRMMYDDHHIFINGEAYRAGGKDAELMRRLADERGLDARSVRLASKAAKALLGEWFVAGWLHAMPA